MLTEGWVKQKWPPEENFFEMQDLIMYILKNNNVYIIFGDTEFNGICTKRVNITFWVHRDKEACSITSFNKQTNN